MRTSFRQQHRHRLACGFSRCVAIQIFRTLVPCQNDPIQRLADNRIFSRLNDGGEFFRAAF